MIDESLCKICGKEEYRDGFMKHAGDHEFQPELETDEERADRLIQKYFCLGPANSGAPPDEWTMMLLDAMREVRAKERDNGRCLHCDCTCVACTNCGGLEIGLGEN